MTAIHSLDVQVNSIRNFPSCWLICVSFGIGNLHVISVHSHEYFKNQFSESHDLFPGVIKVFPAFVQFSTYLGKTIYKKSKKYTLTAILVQIDTTRHVI